MPADWELSHHVHNGTGAGDFLAGLCQMEQERETFLGGKGRMRIQEERAETLSLYSLYHLGVANVVIIVCHNGPLVIFLIVFVGFIKIKKTRIKRGAFHQQ